MRQNVKNMSSFASNATFHSFHSHSPHVVHPRKVNNEHPKSPPGFPLATSTSCMPQQQQNAHEKPSEPLRKVVGFSPSVAFPEHHDDRLELPVMRTKESASTKKSELTRHVLQKKEHDKVCRLSSDIASLQEEDRAFEALWPKEIAAMKEMEHLERLRDPRVVTSAVEQVSLALEGDEMLRGKVYNVYGRVKSRKETWCKIQQQNQSDTHRDVYDVAAVRVILSPTAIRHECYLAMRVLHDAFPGVKERFRDYIIRMKKRNGYRSLHDTLLFDITIDGKTAQYPVEVQVRTCKMHYVAEYGTASHQLSYKKTNNLLQTHSADDVHALYPFFDEDPGRAKHWLENKIFACDVPWSSVYTHSESHSTTTGKDINIHHHQGSSEG